MKKALLVVLLVVFATMATFGASLTVWCSEKQVDFMKKAGAEFAKKTGTTVNVQQVNFGDIKSKYLTAAQAGQGPDIIVGAHDWVGELTKSGLLESIELGTEKDKFAGAAVNAFTVNGKLYGVPYAMEAVAVLYNKELVKTPPKSASELVALAKKIGTKEQLGFIYDINNFYFSYGFLAGNGGYVFKWSKANGYDVKDVGLANAGSVKGGDILKSFMTVIPQGANYNTMDTMFKEGNAAMIVNGPWAIADYLKAGIDIGVIPLTQLQLSTGKYGKPFVGVQGLMVNAKSKNKNIAKEFVVKFLANKEGVYEFYKADPRLPARADVAQLIETKGGPVPKDIINAFIKSAAGGEPMPNVPEMGGVWDPMADALRFITTDKLSSEEALKQAVNKINATIK